MTYLITGGCGFIGTNLVYRLLEQDEKIIILDNYSNSRKTSILDFSDKVKVIEGTVTNLRLMEYIMFNHNIDIVIHLAAQSGVDPSVKDPVSDFENNVKGTFNCLEASRVSTVKRFVFASSGSCVGQYDPPFHENLVPKPTAPYSASKAISEIHCYAYNYTYGLEAVSLRFGNIYGPYSEHKDNLIPNIIKDKIKNKYTNIYGDGKQTRDFLYVDDLLNAILLAAKEENLGGQIFQIATSRETSVMEIMDTLNEIFEEMNMGKIKSKTRSFRKGDLRRNYSDITRAEYILKWRSKYSLKDGLTKTVKWFLENYK